MVLTIAGLWPSCLAWVHLTREAMRLLAKHRHFTL
jgi:hypothetical protein